MNVKFETLLPTHQAFVVAGFKTVDAFRMHLQRDPKAPQPVKIGHANFYQRTDLETLKQRRHAAQKAK
ncbi:hypothetical protein [Bradyrhizobium sp. CCGE-LA001]|uniref:hypothetical protein n=1 Tax=Bradyrhizobium sp. CCGE-LA001 TaxID=1223566 RepID=UPI0011981DE4|nr:hypothetical protein [Bradyrhizobium sp. CCGE-LA001]